MRPPAVAAEPDADADVVADLEMPGSQQGTGPALTDRVMTVIAASGQDVTEGSEMMKMITSMPMMQMLGLAGGAIDGDWLLSLLEPEPTAGAAK